MLQLSVVSSYTAGTTLQQVEDGKPSFTGTGWELMCEYYDLTGVSLHGKYTTRRRFQSLSCPVGQLVATVCIQYTIG